MAREKNGAQQTSKDSQGESVSAYFRKIFAEKPKLLSTRSNDELLKRWLSDHPGEKEVPERIKANLANIKSVLRKKKRRKRAQRAEADAAAPQTAAAPPVPRRVHRLESLEEHIDDVLTLAKNLDRNGLASVINHLRRARNEVVWMMGK